MSDAWGKGERKVTKEKSYVKIDRSNKKVKDNQTGARKREETSYERCRL